MTISAAAAALVLPAQGQEPAPSWRPLCAALLFCVAAPAQHPPARPPPSHTRPTQLVKKRPLAPDVFEIDMKGPHYKFPWGAITSIGNRVSGCLLTAGARLRERTGLRGPRARGCTASGRPAAAGGGAGARDNSSGSVPAPDDAPQRPNLNQTTPPGFAAAGYVALTGDLPGALAALKANHPVLAVPAKFIISYPLIYHYMGGLRHFVWDLHKIGNNADKTSLLEKDRVEQSSKVLVAVSLAVASLVSLM